MRLRAIHTAVYEPGKPPRLHGQVRTFCDWLVLLAAWLSGGGDS